MALLDKFKKGDTILGYSGKNPSSQSSTKDSTLHFTYSINKVPELKNLPPPSRLDLDGKKPTEYSTQGPSDGRY